MSEFEVIYNGDLQVATDDEEIAAVVFAKTAKLIERCFDKIIEEDVPSEEHTLKLNCNELKRFLQIKVELGKTE